MRPTLRALPNRPHPTLGRQQRPNQPDNGGPACARHNRWKQQHGFRTWRDPTGQWHTYRPDGTEIAPHTNPTATEIRQHEFSSG